MSNFNRFARCVRATFFAILTLSPAFSGYAGDVVPAPAQSDEQISVWANNASLELFVSQLAGMTGRQAAVEDKAQVQISGRFNGSMIDTLNAVSEQYQMLFNLDQNVLGVVAESARSSATIALGDAIIDDELQTSLSSDLLYGNEIQLREEEVVVSGHPEFVKGVVRLVTTTIADAGQRSDTQQASTADQSVIGVVALQEEPLPEPALPVAREDDIADEQVSDAAASIMLEQAPQESLPADSSDTAESPPATYRWVTDIPGYETF